MRAASIELAATISMEQVTEVDCIDGHLDGEQPPNVWLQLTAEVSGPPDEVLGRIRDVFRIVALRRATEWAEDSWWLANLPAWFVQSSWWRPPNSTEDLSRWDILSWLDAIKDTGWVWWSSAIRTNTIEINLWAYEYPYRIGVFEHLVMLAGGRDVKVCEPEVA